MHALSMHPSIHPSIHALIHRPRALPPCLPPRCAPRPWACPPSSLAIDYSVHLGHAYHEAPYASREAKVTHALITMGASILNAGGSTLLGTLFLARSDSVRSAARCARRAVRRGRERGLGRRVCVLARVQRWVGRS